MPPHARVGSAQAGRECLQRAYPPLRPYLRFRYRTKLIPTAKSRDDRSKPGRRRPERLPGSQVRGDLHDVRPLTGPDGELPDDPVAAIDFQYGVLDAGVRGLFGEGLRLRFGSPDREVLFRDVGGGDDLSPREVDDVLREHPGIVDEVDLRPRRLGRNLLVAVRGEATGEPVGEGQRFDQDSKCSLPTIGDPDTGEHRPDKWDLRGRRVSSDYLTPALRSQENFSAMHFSPTKGKQQSW